MQGDCILVPLSQGKFAIIDAVDAERILPYKWHCSLGYAVRNRRKPDGPGAPIIRMHRVINDTPDGMETDHVDGDRLNNRRSNLRSVTMSQNSCNSRTYASNTSGYRGVSWAKREKRWTAQIWLNQKHRHVGYFATAEEAARARDAAALEVHGEFAILNFPHDKP